MKQFLTQLFASSDDQVSALHVALILMLVIAATAMLVPCLVALGYAWYHGFSLLPEYASTERALFEGVAMFVTSIGAAFWMKGAQH